MRTQVHFRGILREPQPLPGGSRTVRLFLTLATLLCFGIGGAYVFAVNERAVYGYDIRNLETEIVSLKKANTDLRLQEAEGRSLLRVEVGSANLRMEKAEPSDQLMIKKSGSVAYR